MVSEIIHVSSEVKDGFTVVEVISDGEQVGVEFSSCVGVVSRGVEE